MQSKSVSSAILIGLLSFPSVFADTRYAKPSGLSSGDCKNSWSNACTLPRAIDQAQSSTSDQVWVMQGTYGPITLKTGVKVFGGFAGTETAASQSDPAAHVTTIDGANTQAVLSSGNGSSTMLRGFTIKNGYDNTFDGGGGLRMVDSSAAIVQCIFESNTATWFGGAVAVRGSSSPQFVNCVFKFNGEKEISGASGSELIETIAGAAIFVYTASPTFINCLFHNNKSGEGAAIANDSGSPTLINCTLVNNQATIGYGGGIFDQGGDVTVRNSIIWGNTSIRGGNQIFNGQEAVTSASNSNVQGGFTGSNNMDTDPQFIQGFKIPSTSPCKNAGDNSALQPDVVDLDWDNNTIEKTPKDLGLSNRKIELIVDIGTYEAPAGTGSQ